MQRFCVYSHTYQVLFRVSDFFVLRRTWALMESVGLGGASYVAYLDVGSFLGLAGYYLSFVVVLLLCRTGCQQRLSTGGGSDWF